MPGRFLSALGTLEASGNLRTIPSAPARSMVDMASNDYLGLAARYDAGEFAELAAGLAGRHNLSSSASRLLAIRQEEYAALEGLLASLYGGAALLFNSGYHANVGLIQALAGPGTLFLVDRLAHASVYDGLMAAGAKCRWKRFAHNDMAALESLVERHYDEADTIVTVVESVYSMDGDTAPLRELAALRDRCDRMLLYVDEAHAVGVRGRRGLGLAEELGVTDRIDLLAGTFGKALASSGAFVACAPDMRGYLVNSARPLIFSTAIPPLSAAWTREMLLRSLTMEQERNSLARLSEWFSGELERVTGGRTSSASQIVPLVTGDAARAVSLAARLREGGYLALPIRRPTVPPGGERIRFSLNAGMTRDMLEPLVGLLEQEYRTI